MTFECTAICGTGVEVDTAAVNLGGRNWQLNQRGQGWQYIDGLDRKRLLEAYDARSIKENRNPSVIVPRRTVGRHVSAHVYDGCYVGFRRDDEIT